MTEQRKLREIIDDALHAGLVEAQITADEYERVRAWLDCTGGPGCPIEGHEMTPVPGMEPS